MSSNPRVTFMLLFAHVVGFPPRSRDLKAPREKVDLLWPLSSNSSARKKPKFR